MNVAKFQIEKARIENKAKTDTLNRAAWLYQRDRLLIAKNLVVRAHTRKGFFRVQDKGKVYTVKKGFCSGPCASFLGGQPCEHRYAVWLSLPCEEKA